jgi:hypothetical protein
VVEIFERIYEICQDDGNSWSIAFHTFANFEGIKEMSPELISIQVIQTLTQVDINNCQWSCLKEVKDVELLMKLVLHWILNLKEPPISDTAHAKIEDPNIDISKKLEQLEKSVFETINYMIHFFRRVFSI